MKVAMTNLSPRMIFVPGGEVLEPGERKEIVANPSEYPEMGWYLSKSFEVTISRIKKWHALLREVTYSHLRIGSVLMSVRV